MKKMNLTSLMIEANLATVDSDGSMGPMEITDLSAVTGGSSVAFFDFNGVCDGIDLRSKLTTVQLPSRINPRAFFDFNGIC